MWKEAVSLAPPSEAKGIVANAIRHLPNSVSLWKLAAQLETDVSAKKVQCSGSDDVHFRVAFRLASSFPPKSSCLQSIVYPIDCLIVRSVGLSS